MTVVVVIIWWGSSFSLWSDWDAWTDGSDSMLEEMSVNLNEKNKMMMIQTIVYGYVYLFIYFFFFVRGQIFWVAVLFCLNAWGLELCVVFGCLLSASVPFVWIWFLSFWHSLLDRLETY